MKLLLFILALTPTLTQAGDLSDSLSRFSQRTAPVVTQPEFTEPDYQPTPHVDLRSALAKLDIKESDTFVDFGCGDGRAVIAAAQTYGCRAIGIEIDPAMARRAKLAVESAGLSDRVEIIVADATKIDVDADVGFVYLWPETLGELRVELTRLDRFASFQHKVPGLEMVKAGDSWFWGTEPEVAAAEPEPQYEEVRERYISGYRQVKYCNGRQCWYQNEPVYEYRMVRKEKKPEQTRVTHTKSVPKQEPVRREPVRQVTQPVRTQRVAYWGNQQYTTPVCNSRNCTMCNSIRAQLGWR